MTRRTLALLTLSGLMSLSVVDARAATNNNRQVQGNNPAGRARNPKAKTDSDAKADAAPNVGANANQSASGGATQSEQPPPSQRPEDRLKTLEEAVKNTGAKVDALSAKVDGLQIPTPTPDYERWGVLAALGLTLAGLAVLGYLTLKSNRVVRELREKMRATSEQWAANTQPLASSINSLESSFTTALATQKEELLEEIKGLKRAVEALSRKPEKEKWAEPAAEPAAADGGGRRPGGAAQLDYPSSVDDCINQLRKAQVTLVPVRPDLGLYGNLSRDEDNKFWLAQESSNPEHLLFPKAHRLSSGDEFHTFYANYYECAEPSAGDVSIIRPGVVVDDETHGGWKLKSKGLLKVV